MKTRLAAMLVILAALLAACAPVEEPLAEEDAPTPTETEPTEAAEEPTAEPTAPVSIGTPELDVTDTGDAENGVPNAVLVAQQMLSQQIDVSPEEITVVDYEQVEWPDACLGLDLGDELCAQQVTPGYRITLEADGGEYAVHTDEAGQSAALASAPDVSLENPIISWESPDPPCQEAVLGAESVVYGLCEGAQLRADHIDEQRGGQLEEFAATYQSFDAETVAGSISLEGQGDTEPTEAEERMLAEWTRLAAIEASTGQRSLELGLTMLWHREGGIAGFCDDLLVYASGTVRVFSCEGEQLAEGALGAEDLEQFYTWLDTYGQFTIDQTDEAEADALTIQMIFAGRGAEQPTEEEQQAVQEFAQEQFNQVSEEE